MVSDFCKGGCWLMYNGFLAKDVPVGVVELVWCSGRMGMTKVLWYLNNCREINITINSHITKYLHDGKLNWKSLKKLECKENSCMQQRKIDVERLFFKIILRKFTIL